jgi:heme o synthase
LELSTPTTFTFKSIFQDFKEITKAGLAISVLFSSIAGYLLGFDAEHPFSWTTLIMLWLALPMLTTKLSKKIWML